MFSASVVVVTLLLCTSVSGINMTIDLQSYLSSLWNVQKNYLGSLVQDFSPKLDLKLLTELVRGQMSEPYPELGLPVLDPLYIDVMYFDVDHEIGEYHGHTKNLTILHLSQFQVEKLVLNLIDLKAEFNFSFTEIHLKGVYEHEGSFARMIPTWGNGDFELSVHDVNLNGSLQMGAEQEFLYMNSFDVDCTFLKITGNVTGLHGGEELGKILSDSILDLAPAIFNMMRPDLSPWISKQVLDISNRRLREISIKKTNVMEWLKKIATNRILSLTQSIKRELSSACTITTSLFSATYCDF